MKQNSKASSSGLSWLKLIQLSRVSLWRELRAGQMNIIVLALILAVTAATIISVFSSRIDAGMLNKSTELLGADLRVRSSKALPDSFYHHAHSLDLKTSTTLEFPSMVMVGEEMTLAALKAVDQNYPLKGSVMVAQDAFASLNETEQTAETDIKPNSEAIHSGPNSGEVWVESRLLALLNAQVGDAIEVGRSSLKIAAVITQESDRGGNFYSLSPRLMMHLDDVENAGLIQTGSRVTWRILAATNANLPQQQTAQIIDEYKQWLNPQLAAHQSIESLSDNNQALAGALDKARSYLSLAAILAILLSGIAIAMAASDYAQHHFDTSALLRTLGASRRQVLSLFTLQLLYLAILSSVVGLIFGSLIQNVLVDILSGLFVRELPPAGWTAWAIACATAPFTLLGFALPHLLRIGRVSPLRVLRRELEPMSWNSWAIYSLAIAAVFILSFWFTRNVRMSAIIVFGGFIALLVLMAILQILLKLAAGIVPAHRFSLYIRFAWQHIIRDSRKTSAQVLAFSMILMVMIIIATVRNDLLADWQRSLPEDAPNFFAMNIQSYEVEQYQQTLDKAGFERNPLFPMVPGRLTEINNQNVQLDDQLKEEPALQRDLALTWSEALPSGNKILQGQWLQTNENSIQGPQVSVEAGLAKRLKIQLDDQLSFDVAGEIFKVTVTSIRSVDWGSLSPNFYMIFSLDVLQHLPVSYLTSFHVPAQKNQQLTQLIRAYPTITLLDMSMVFIQIQRLLEQVSLAVEYLLLLVLLAGILVLMAALHTSLDERIQQGAILRTLGASRAQLRLSQWSEFSLLGLIAGVIALAGAEAICLVLYNKLFDLDYQLQWPLWLWLPICSTLLITLLGALATRRVSKHPPIVVLREV